MSLILNFRYLLFVTMLCSSAANAGVYISVAPSWVFVDATSETTRPLVADVRLGYQIDKHQLELATMSSIKEDTLNQLTVDVPSINSIFYRYSPYYKDRMKIHLILGASQVDIDSTYPTTPDTTDSFDGVSYGIGFEEAFESIPELKLKFDLIQLYRGDQLNINIMSLGLRYEF